MLVLSWVTSGKLPCHSDLNFSHIKNDFSIGTNNTYYYKTYIKYEIRK